MRINLQKLLPVIIRDNYTTLMQMIEYDQIKIINVSLKKKQLMFISQMTWHVYFKNYASHFVYYRDRERDSILLLTFDDFNSMQVIH